MDKHLAERYCAYDNYVNHAFDKCQLDLIPESFRRKREHLMNIILHTIIKDNKCSWKEGDDSLSYLKDSNYDNAIIKQLVIYFDLCHNYKDIRLETLNEVLTGILDSYARLNGFSKDSLGYWYDEHSKEVELEA